jgi:hypothetical protein
VRNNILMESDLACRQISYAKEWLIVRAELYELKSDVVSSRVALTVVGAVVVVSGTLMSYVQLVYAQAKLPVVIESQTDWRGYPLLSLTHDPGFVIAIVAILAVVFEVRAQWLFTQIQKGFLEWTAGGVCLEFMTVTVIASLVLFSWPLRGQGFAANNQGVVLHGHAVGSAHAISAQLLVLRGPGAVVSFVGIALLFYAIVLQVVALWQVRPRTRAGDGDLARQGDVALFVKSSSPVRGCIPVTWGLRPPPTPTICDISRSN